MNPKALISIEDNETVNTNKSKNKALSDNSIELIVLKDKKEIMQRIIDKQDQLNNPIEILQQPKEKRNNTMHKKRKRSVDKKKKHFLKKEIEHSDSNDDEILDFDEILRQVSDINDYIKPS